MQKPAKKILGFILCTAGAAGIVFGIAKVINGTGINVVEIVCVLFGLQFIGFGFTLGIRSKEPT